MPFLLKNDGKLFVNRKRQDEKLTEQMIRESKKKAAQIKKYYMAQDSFLEQYHALSEIQRRYGAQFTYSDPMHKGDYNELNRKTGDIIIGSSVREYNMENDIFLDFAKKNVKNLDDLAELYTAQGLLQENSYADMELERQKFLSQIPENDPLREQKADYFVLHTDGASAKHTNLRNTSTMIYDQFSDVPGDAYREFSERYQGKTGKNTSEMSLREFAEELEIPEEKRSGFYAQFDYEGHTASPEDRFEAVVTARNPRPILFRSAEEIKSSIERAFFGHFSAAMIDKGARLAQALATPERQKLMDAGRRFNDQQYFEVQEEENKALKSWIKKEGFRKAIDLSMGNIEKCLLDTDQTIIKDPKKGGVPLEGDLRQASLLNNDGAYCLAHNKMRRCEEQLRSAATVREKNELAAEYLLAKRIVDHIGHGGDRLDFPAYKVDAMRKEIRKSIVEPMQAGTLGCDELVSRLNAPERAEEIEEISDRVEDRFRVSHEKYIFLHTGEDLKKTPDEKVDDLAKCLAAHALKEAGQKFDLKQIHKFAGHMKEIYSLDTLKQFPERLSRALTDQSAVLRMGREMRHAVYGVKKEEYGAYTASMKKLADSMVDPKGHSREYKNLVACVKKAAALEATTKDLSAEKKAEAFRQANLDIFEATKKYTKGKERVRRTREGRACFNNALDAVATVSRFAPGANVRTSELLLGINMVRNNGNPQSVNYINTNNFTEAYGAERAEMNKPAAKGQQAVAQAEDRILQ